MGELAALPWTLDPLVLEGVALAALLYARGWRRGRGDDTLTRAAAFYGGLAVILVALVSPLDAAANLLFLAHMVQHLLLIMVAVPLLLLGAPAGPLLRGIPRSMRVTLVAPLARNGALRAGLHLLTRPIVALGSYVVLLTLWHLPALYDAALADAKLHALEHATYLFIALLFWTQVIDPLPFRATLPHPLRIVYLFIATAHNTALGGILSFAATPLYQHYARLPVRPLGISPEADQQWGGITMWVPGGMIHLVAISIVFAAWLRAEDRAADERERPDLESRRLPDAALR